MPGIAEIGGKTSCGTNGFEVPVAALEVKKVGGVVGCVLHESESESVWMRKQMEVREMSGSNLVLVPDQGHPYSSLGVQEPAAIHEEQGPSR